LVQWEPVKYKKPSEEAAAWPEVGPLWLQSQPNAILRYLLTARAKARGWADRLPQLSYYDSMRANPATSAPSHICETWRNVAQTCLIIKGMGPERSRINVSDPI